MRALDLVACMVAGALANRMRGGLWGDAIRLGIGHAVTLAAALFTDPLRALAIGEAVARVVWGTQGARLLAWGLPSGLVAWAAGAPAWLACAVGVAAWAGSTAGQGDGLAMGHRGGGAAGWRAWAGMLGWGVSRVLLVVLVLGAAMGPGVLTAAGALAFLAAVWPLLAAGALCPVIYEAVWHVPTWAYRRGFGYGDGPAAGFDPPELAEAVHGAPLMVALFMVILGVM